MLTEINPILKSICGVYERPSDAGYQDEWGGAFVYVIAFWLFPLGLIRAVTESTGRVDFWPILAFLSMTTLGLFGFWKIYHLWAGRIVKFSISNEGVEIISLKQQATFIEYSEIRSLIYRQAGGLPYNMVIAYRKGSKKRSATVPSWFPHKQQLLDGFKAADISCGWIT
jgi:hypothetical protein